MDVLRKLFLACSFTSFAQVASALDMPPVPPSMMQKQLEPLGSIKAANIFFTKGSAVVAPESVVEIKALAAKLDGLPVYVVIEAYTDLDGDEEKNQILSEQRAAAVATLFAETGKLVRNQLIEFGYGETYSQGIDGKAKDTDRRVVMTVMRPIESSESGSDIVKELKKRGMKFAKTYRAAAQQKPAMTAQERRVSAREEFILKARNRTRWAGFYFGIPSLFAVDPTTKPVPSSSFQGALAGSPEAFMQWSLSVRYMRIGGTVEDFDLRVDRYFVDVGVLPRIVRHFAAEVWTGMHVGVVNSRFEASTASKVSSATTEKDKPVASAAYTETKPHVSAEIGASAKIPGYGVSPSGVLLCDYDQAFYGCSIQIGVTLINGE